MAITAISAALGLGRLIALPFFLGVTVTTTAAGLTSYNPLFFVCGLAYVALVVLIILFPMPDTDKGAAKKEGLVASLKRTKFSVGSIAMILIGFTCSDTQ